MSIITIVTPFYKPSIGGVEYIAYHTAKELVKCGFEVHIITTIYNNMWEKVANPGTTIDENVFVHRLKTIGIKVGYATIMKGLKKLLWKIKPNIVHCHNLHPHLFQTIKWREELDYKLVAQLHYPIATGMDNLSARLLYRIAMRKLVQRQRRIDVFIAHTNMEKQWLINEGIKEKKIHILDQSKTLRKTIEVLDLGEYRKGIIRAYELPYEKKAKLIESNKDWGEIICRCEHVSKAEIIAAINNPLGVKTLNGIKKRTRAMTGRCQGGFCLPRIIEILEKFVNNPVKEITLKGEGSELFTGRTRECQETKQSTS